MARYIKLAGVTITDPAAPRALTTYLSDNFNRANGPLTTAPDGKPYIMQYGANLVVAENAAGGTGIVNPSNPQAHGAKAIYETGTSEVEVSITYSAGYNGMGPFIRASDTFSGYAIQGNGANQIDVLRFDSGTVKTTIKTFPGFGITAGMVVKVVCAGDVMSIYRNGVLLGTVTDATYKGTKHGIRLSADTNRLDDLLITSLR